MLPCLICIYLFIYFFIYKMNITFNLEDEEGIRNSIEENGVVVILDVLNKEEIDGTLKDVEDIIKKMANTDAFNINDPSTYHFADHIMNQYGVIGKTALF